MSGGDPGVAVVGLGSWGKNLLRVVADRATVPLACHAGDPSTAAWLGRHYPAIERVTDYEAVLGDDRVDAVVVATPTETHAALARRALAADRDVFVEKPLAAHADDAERVVEAADGTDATLFVGYLFVHHPLVRAVRSIHGVDPVAELRATWHKTGSFDADVVRNLASHHVAVAEALFGPTADGPGCPTADRGDGGARVVDDGRQRRGGDGGDRPGDDGHERPGGDERADDRPVVTVLDRFGAGGGTDAVTAALEYGGGRCVTTVDRVSPGTYHVMVARTAGGDLLAWGDDRLSVLAGDGFRPVLERTREPLAVEVESFLECVRTGRRPPTDGRFGLRVARVLDALSGAGAGAGDS